MSQARLPRTEPSTELITAHKVIQPPPAHVAGRAPGIFAKVRSHRVIDSSAVVRSYDSSVVIKKALAHPSLQPLKLAF